MRPSIIDVTPALAAEWLTRNRANREVDTGAVKRYADAMLGGRWRLADQSVKFKVGGDLLDGQHRLMAVVRSGATVPMLVLTEVEHWTIWHPGGANHLSTEWCYTCDLERAIDDLREDRARVWDEGRAAERRDWEFTFDLATPDEERQSLLNPYRAEASGLEGER